MKTQIDFYLRGAEVTRYHTLSTLQRETVGHHSHGVALLVTLLQPEARAEVLRAALLHDLAEHLTGDIPSPAKRLYGIGEQVSTVEHSLLEAAGFKLPPLTPDEHRLLKLADLAHGALFCVREIGLGNRRMLEVFRRYMTYAEELNLQGRERDLFNDIMGYYYEQR